VKANWSINVMNKEIEKGIVQKSFNSVLDMVGNTPVVKLPLNGVMNVECYVKLEGCNPTASLKDRVAKAIFLDKINKGELKPGMRILDASSGSYACALSLFGKILGYPVTVTTGSKVTEDKAWFIKYFGAELIPHGKLTIEGNQYCKELHENNPGKYCFFDQLHNQKNFDAHYETTGPEILRDIPDIAAVVCSVGSGGTISGTAQFLKDNNPDIKVIAVTAASGTKIPGVGAFVDGDYETPFIKHIYNEKLIDHTSLVSIKDAQEQLLYLRDNGFFVGIQTGGILAGMLDGIKKLDITGKVVIVSGDAGWKGQKSLGEIVL
jgi:[CysO sulfur-carrier protein]-thiocarboxylate-dependent cysteine synthase